MENAKTVNPVSQEKQNDEKIKTTKNRNVDDRNVNKDLRFGIKTKVCRPSMIPVMRNEKIDAKSFVCKKRPGSSSKSLSASKAERQKEDFDYKLKVLREKEKSIADYYLKIEEMLQKSMAQKRDNVKLSNRNYGNSAARKMTSDPSVISRNRIKSDISDFENNIQQISHIWLKTTSDLSSTLRNLKCNPRVDPTELQMENIRIQLAIKQAKSLTLVKTRSVIAEAKKLFRNREIIRSELENLLNYDNSKNESKNDQCLEDMEKSFIQQNLDEQGMDETGDSLKDIADADSLENINDNFSDKITNKERFENEGLVYSRLKTVGEDIFSEKDANLVERTNNKNPDTSYQSKIMSELEAMKKELIKKNKTITNLNKKIFDLQKTCTENSTTYNQLQVKLLEFQEKIQWNQVLWKQIGKLKERIKGYQQNNKELEFQKKELESKIIKREQEIDRLVKLNHILNQKKHLLNAQEITVTECIHGPPPEEAMQNKCFKKIGNKLYIDEKVINEKQTAINQLKKILNVMKDQENFAQKQISMFQSRIEELEKNGKA